MKSCATTWLVVFAVAASAAAAPSVVVDPELPYWKSRSADSVAEEIKANGYAEARIMCGGDLAALRDLTKAFDKAGVKTWLLVDLTAVPKSGLPDGWEAWKMKLRKLREGGPEYLCPNNPAYLEWRRKQLASALQEQPFLGVDFTGAFFPSENSPEDESCGCFCKSCIAAFKKMCKGVTGPPDFENPDSSNYWKTNTALYEKWVGFRAASIVGAVDAIVNGEDGIRKKCPGVKIAVWCPGAADPQVLKRLRENMAVDAAALVNRVKPDALVVKTDRSDWVKPDLSAGYSTGYKHIVEAIHEIATDMPVMLQTDIGSTQDSRRTRLWMGDMAKRAREAGFADVVFDEYSLGDYIYTEPPILLKAALGEGKIRLVFNKRLDSAAASNIGHYSLTSGQIDYAGPDGNVVVLSVSGTSSGLTVRVSGLSDDETARKFHDKPACAMDREVSMTVDGASPSQ